MTPDRVVVSGIDGGLLDPVTKDYDPARPAIAALARLGVPLVLCSCRPRAEVALVSRLFGLGAPMIVENGAAVIVPDGHLPHGVPGGQWDGECHVLRLGPPRERLREALAEVAAAARVQLRTVAELPTADRPHGGGLAGLLGPYSHPHEHTEPFLLARKEDAAALAREAEARGLRVAKGERFFYLSGGADKGLAVRTLLSLYEREGRLPKTVALGAWPVDLPMLRAAHRPILMPGLGGGVEPSLAAALPRAELAPHAGPEGWNDAVLAVVTGRRLPTVTPRRDAA
ncbi:MAG TPA: HAD hydrolase family protein [Vicinamibacteria bacterium]|nr:HAD hydrolase family protein [Vicinamibacteria bacterium]